MRRGRQRIQQYIGQNDYFQLIFILAKHNLNVNFEPIVYHDPNPISHRQRHEKSRKMIGYHHRPISQSNTVRVPSQLSSRRCELQELPKQFKYMPSALVDKCLQESIAKGKIGMILCQTLLTSLAPSSH